LRKILFALIPLLFITLAPTSLLKPVLAANPVVAVDLAHGESNKYLAYIQGNITTVSWKLVDANTTVNDAVLSNVDFLMVGQPTKPFTADELQALKTWFNKGGKGVWAAADSDFGPGVDSINIVNSIMETVGSALRADQASLEDPVSGMQQPYRVPGVVDPDSGAETVKAGITNPVLYHGPGVIAYVKPDGSWNSLSTSKPDSVMRIVWTNNTKAKIVENSAPIAKAYSAGQEGRFVLLAAEKLTVAGRTNLAIACGESPYGDYEPTWASVYYAVKLDGPKFVTNMINWSTTLVTTIPVTTTTATKPPTSATSVTPATTATSAAPSAGFDLTTIIVVVAIVIVVAGVVLYTRRKK
jgi:hypothetical protein